MKKLILAMFLMTVGFLAVGGRASAHHLDVTGTSSCVREDGTWDWTASYTIPNEPWAQGLTVVVTWNPSNSGTSSAAFVNVSANGVFSNGNQGGGSVKIHKGQKCPVVTTTTTTLPPPPVTTTTTIPETTTTWESTTSTSSPTTSSTPTTSVVPESTDSTTTIVIAETPVPATTTTETPQVSLNPPSQNNPPPQTEMLPPTGMTADTARFFVILAICGIAIGIVLMTLSKLRRS